MDLGGIRHGSRRSLSFLCEQLVMTLGGIRHLGRLAFASFGNIPTRRTSLRAMTYSLQSQDRLLIEP